jgi:hydrogenase nickel incorporation protein HypA/HybF
VVHELSITRNIVAIVAEHARGRPVRRVTLEIGVLSAVVPDAVRFCFDVVSTGTPLAGAELVIDVVPATGRCRVCGATFAVQTPVAACACGARDVALQGGDELKIRTMELRQEKAPCA